MIVRPDGHGRTSRSGCSYMNPNGRLLQEPVNFQSLLARVKKVIFQLTCNDFSDGVGEVGKPSER